MNALVFTAAPPPWSGYACRCALACCIAMQLTLAHAAPPAWEVPGGSVQRGSQRIAQLGCPACHTIPGIRNAEGNVGPPLTRFGDRTFIAGMLRNTPPNLVRWIREPQAVIPGNAMPNMGISGPDARDIAAYLYTLR
jgi:cytochrome c2